jgi:mono/diheme cytochrome c family protein
VSSGPLLSGRFHRHIAALVVGWVPLLAALSPAALAHRGITPAANVRGDVVQGRKLFRANCGGCHTLTAAGTHGRVGPNLNSDDLSYATVVWMVQNGDSVMPGFRGVIKPVEIRNIAAFVTGASAA